MSTTQAISAWINENRQISPLLDDDADALLARLTALTAQETALENAAKMPCTVGLFGHSQAAKAHLLAALCDSGNGRLHVLLGEKTLDYFSHLNPGHMLTSMALRFSRENPRVDDNFPLRLRLISEAELVQVFIAHAQAMPECVSSTKRLLKAVWQNGAHCVSQTRYRALARKMSGNCPFLAFGRTVITTAYG
jgi:hypothetical protein